MTPKEPGEPVWDVKGGNNISIPCMVCVSKDARIKHLESRLAAAERAVSYASGTVEKFGICFNENGCDVVARCECGTHEFLAALRSAQEAAHVCLCGYPRHNTPSECARAMQNSLKARENVR